MSLLWTESGICSGIYFTALLFADIVLSAVFIDGTDSLQATLTPTVVHGLLHRDPEELKKLSGLEWQDALSVFVNVEMILCLSKV